jgi:hypothetical protein
MPGTDLFEYAVIRIVPRVEREEFLNAGVILYCKRPAFLGMRYILDEKRLQALHPDIDLADIKANLDALEQVCQGNTTASPIAALDIAGRFRWLTAKRSTVVQFSAVHPGLCSDPGAALERMFRQMVVE